jgi:hypothetical protein
MLDKRKTGKKEGRKEIVFLTALFYAFGIILTTSLATC